MPCKANELNTRFVLNHYHQPELPSVGTGVRQSKTTIRSLCKRGKGLKPIFIAIFPLWSAIVINIKASQHSSVLVRFDNDSAASCFNETGQCLKENTKSTGQKSERKPQFPLRWPPHTAHFWSHDLSGGVIFSRSDQRITTELPLELTFSSNKGAKSASSDLVYYVQNVFSLGEFGLYHHLDISFHW